MSVFLEWVPEDRDGRSPGAAPDPLPESSTSAAYYVIDARDEAGVTATPALKAAGVGVTICRLEVAP